MERNTTGKARIRGRLPQGTCRRENRDDRRLAQRRRGDHAARRAGQLLLAVFIKQSNKPFEDRERVIADLSRALYDYYLFGAAR